MTPHETIAPPQVPADVARQAVEWLVELQAEEAGEHTRSAWQRWRAAHPDHERAWQHIEAVDSRWRALASPLAAATAHAVLKAPASKQRRQAVKTLALVLFAGGSAWMGERNTPWRSWLADERTGVGQRRHLTLADGTAVTLNTDSAVSIRFDHEARRIQLAEGELFIETAPNGRESARPLLVETTHGVLRALGTRFCVRLLQDSCSVAVFQGAVEVRTPGGARALLAAGKRLSLSAAGIGDARPADETETAWIDGMLIASSMRLADFIADLQRYHRGVLQCDPAVADLRISGSYPLDDTERVLVALAAVLPVKVQHFTRYWTRLVPKES